MKKVIKCSTQPVSNEKAFWQLHEPCYEVGAALEDAADELDLGEKIFDDNSAVEGDYARVIEKAEESVSYFDAINAFLKVGCISEEDAVKFLTGIIDRNNIHVSLKDVAELL